MTMRITGLASGLDTESIITELTKIESKKVDKIKNDQKKHDMRMDKWKELNKKVVSFYNKTLSNLRFDSSYVKKTTTASNNDAVSIITNGTAMNSMQKMSVDKLASSAYMTGSKLKSKMGDGKVSNSTTLDNLVGYGGTSGTDENIKNRIRIKFGPEPAEGEDDNREYVDIQLNGSDTVAEALDKIKEAKSESGYGVNASFDANQGRIYATSTVSGEAGSFSIDYSATDMNVLQALGMNNSDDMKYTAGEDAQITLNGLQYTSNTNTFEINGLSITAKQVAEDISLTTEDDTSGVYDMIKGFLKEYNELLGEMSTLYNAESDEEYDILTAEMKESMTDEEIDEWNQKIEDGLLHKDPVIGRVMREMKNIMLSSFDMGEVDENGKPFKTSFASFGIATRSYFETEENERGQWHIDGDDDDEYTSGKDDKLKDKIKNDPELVKTFFKQISANMYSKIGDLMKSTEFSSAYTLYDDKTMKKQVDKYKTQLKEAQDKLGKVEDNYYDKFAQMEKAMTKLNEQTNSLAGMLGTG